MIKNTILVVDDEELNLKLFRNFLSREGYNIILVQDSKDVIETVKKKKPDAIIMDIIMPGVSGDIIASQLKTTKETKDIPIILITADIMKEKDKLKADYFIRRPIIGDNLLSILNNIFNKKL